MQRAGSVRVWARAAPHLLASLAASTPPPDRHLDLAAALRSRYERLGDGFLDDLRAGFAVIVHDPGRRQVLLARDGMGEQPLHYALTSAGLATAFHAEDLAAAHGVTGELDPDRFAEFYGHGELSGTRTFFSGVRLVAPGEMLVITPDAVQRRELARPRLDLRIRLTWEQYVEQFAELFRGAVARSVADCDRAAVLLSGGLDSSPIAACAARELAASGRRSEGTGQAPVVGLSWRLTDAEAQESRFVEAVAARSGLDLEWIDCNDAEPFSDLGRWPLHPASPEGTPYRWFHQRSYQRAAERGCRVVLTGFSGDSLYGNARGWAWDLLLDRGVGAAIDRLREVAHEVGWPRVIRSELLSPLLPRARTLRDQAAPYLTPESAERLRSRPTYPPGVERARRPRQARRVLALRDSHGLEFERHFTARFGVDARTPLRDFDLAQFVIASPAHLLQQGKETRPVLREAIRGWVPDEVRLRPNKATFYGIVERGIERACRTWAPRVVNAPDALWRPFVNAASVQRWLAGPRDRGWDTSGILLVLQGELWRLSRSGVDLGSLEP